LNLSGDHGDERKSTSTGRHHGVTEGATDPNWLQARWRRPTPNR
jgi:hypothetical protein